MSKSNQIEELFELLEKMQNEIDNLKKHRQSLTPLTDKFVLDVVKKWASSNTLVSMNQDTLYDLFAEQGSTSGYNQILCPKLYGFKINRDPDVPKGEFKIYKPA